MRRTLGLAEEIRLERQIRSALSEGASVTEVARAFGVSRMTIYRWMERWGIRRRVVLDA